MAPRMSLSRIQRYSTAPISPRPCGAAALARGWLLRIFLLLVFVVQGTIVETHIDFAHAPSAGVAASGSMPLRLASLGQGGRGDKSGLCPLCQEAAMAGHYTSPAPAAFTLRAAAPDWIAPPAGSDIGLVASPHGWLSRAPPE